MGLRGGLFVSCLIMFDSFILLVVVFICLISSLIRYFYFAGFAESRVGLCLLMWLFEIQENQPLNGSLLPSQNCKYYQLLAVLVC
jgi:hypothetical protein